MSLFSDAVINFFVNSKDAENSLGGLEKKFNQTVKSYRYVRGRYYASEDAEGLR